jgi:hypothetical protein
MRRTKVTAEWEQLAISKVTSLDSHDARALSAPQPVPQPEPALESVPFGKELDEGEHNDELLANMTRLPVTGHTVDTDEDQDLEDFLDSVI